MASIVSGYVGKLDPGNNVQYAIGSTAYGVCETGASTPGKTVEMSGFTLMVGATIHVKFVYANTASAPSLNVETTGSYPLKLYASNGTAADFGNDSERNGWNAGAVLCLTFDGEYWVRDQGYNTNTIYELPDFGGGVGTCMTTASNLSKTVSAINNVRTYTPVAGCIVSVAFLFPVTKSEANESITLNICSSGAYPIKLNWQALPSGIIKAGDLATFVFYSDAYHMIASSRWGSNIQTIAQNTYKNWNAGRMTVATYDSSGESLVIVNGVAPSLEQDIRSLL